VVSAILAGVFLKNIQFVVTASSAYGTQTPPFPAASL
jgi:hypothetical protein